MYYWYQNKLRIPVNVKYKLIGQYVLQVANQNCTYVHHVLTRQHGERGEAG